MRETTSNAALIQCKANPAIHRIPTDLYENESGRQVVFNHTTEGAASAAAKGFTLIGPALEHMAKTIAATEAGYTPPPPVYEKGPKPAPYVGPYPNAVTPVIRKGSVDLYETEDGTQIMLDCSDEGRACAAERGYKLIGPAPDEYYAKKQALTTEGYRGPSADKRALSSQ